MQKVSEKEKIKLKLTIVDKKVKTHYSIKNEKKDEPEKSIIPIGIVNIKINH